MEHLINGLRGAAWELIVALLVCGVIAGIIALAMLLGDNDEHKNPPMYK